MATKYDSLKKDELWKEIDARKAAKSPNFDSLTATSTNADLVAALVLDDEHVQVVNAPHPNLPVVDAVPMPESRIKESCFPAEEKFTDGVFIHADQQEKYALAIHEPDAYGRTHSLKNTIHSWQGTKEEFNRVFNKQ